MADQPNGNYDWREEIRRNWEDHDRIYRSIEELRGSVSDLRVSVFDLRVSVFDLRASVDTLRDSNVRLHLDVQNLVEGIRQLVDRIPPENLR